MPLTEKQAAFAREYVKDYNGAAAAIRAGYAKKGAKQAASRALTNVDVRKAVMAASTRKQEIAEVDAAWLLKRLALLVDVRIADLFDEEGNLRAPHDLPDGAQLLVNGIDVVTDAQLKTTTSKIRLESRAKILEMLGKHTDVGAWLEKIQIEENTALGERLQRGRDRLRVVNGGQDDADG